MAIDVLGYELKYKNDSMVLDLLKAYQSNHVSEDEYEELAGEVEMAKEKISELKEAADDAKNLIESSIGELNGLEENHRSGKITLEEVFEFVADIASDLGKAERML